MFERIAHFEIGGGHTLQCTKIIDACKISEGEFEVMAMYANGDELDNLTAETEEKAVEGFAEFVNRYANPFQKAVFNAGLVSGKKYTLLYFSEFGFVVADKITFKDYTFSTYAQYDDVVKMTFRRCRKQRDTAKYFYDRSLIILEGWHDLKDEDTMLITERDNGTIIKRSKYESFSNNFVEDMEKLYKNHIVMIYKDYKTDTNGRIYA